jgi:hypothetical protein
MSKPLIDPKELFPAAVGLAVGVCILVFFVVLAQTMGLQLYVDYGNMPRQ